MHSIIKSSFYIIFLVLAFTFGIKLLLNSKGNKLVMILGLSTLLLGIGEGFHIVPRILEIFANDIDTYGQIIETGRFISSISIIVVYFLLFWFWRVYYKISDKRYLEIVLIVFGFIGVTLSVIFKDSTGYLMVIVRNIPLIVIAAIVIFGYKKQSVLTSDKGFKFMWIPLLLSVVFTLAFELLRFDFDFLIILMMPKTLMYIWVVSIGYLAYKKGLLSI